MHNQTVEVTIEICIHSGILLCELLLELSLEMVCHLHLQTLTAHNTKNENRYSSYEKQKKD